LRKLTTQIAESARAMIASSKTPSPHYQPSCKHCSLQDLCVPRSLEKPPSVSAWLARQVNASLDGE
jgi:CRISPR-associated exonuclease Cas4